MLHTDATLDKRDGRPHVGCREIAEARQIARIHKMWRGKLGHFDMTEG
jgi:hypothetical protein